MKTKFLMLALLVAVLASLLLSMASCTLLLPGNGPSASGTSGTTTKATPPRTQPASTTAAPVTQGPTGGDWGPPMN